MAEAKDPKRISECGSCKAPIRWGKWLTSGKAMPVDAEPVPEGTVVLILRNGKELLIEKFYEPKHGTGRNRYTSHFQSCPNAKQHRRAT